MNRESDEADGNRKGANFLAGGTIKEDLGNNT